MYSGESSRAIIRCSQLDICMYHINVCIHMPLEQIKVECRLFCIRFSGFALLIIRPKPLVAVGVQSSPQPMHQCDTEPVFSEGKKIYLVRKLGTLSSDIFCCGKNFCHSYTGFAGGDQCLQYRLINLCKTRVWDLLFQNVTKKKKTLKLWEITFTRGQLRN